MTNRTKSILRKGLVFALALAWQSGASGCNAVKESEPPVTLAIAWTNTPESYSYTSTILAAEETGANVVLLDQVKSYDLSYDSQDQLTGQKDAHGILSSSAAKRVKTNTWLNSNAEEVLQGVDCVIVPGGWDISPTLYYQEEPGMVSKRTGITVRNGMYRITCCCPTVWIMIFRYFVSAEECRCWEWYPVRK